MIARATAATPLGHRGPPVRAARSGGRPGRPRRLAEPVHRLGPADRRVSARRASLLAMATATERVEIHRWTRRDYYRMAETGLLGPDERTELLDGVVYSVSPQGSRHATGVQALLGALQSAFPGETVRPQMALGLGEYSEPEPDIAVVPGDFRRYRDDHPSSALLVAEVAYSSLRHDRLRKLPLYARWQIPEVWIVNLRQGALEVYRDPAGGTYRSCTVLRQDDSVSPLARPGAVLRVSDLLP
jgi:Uma2 family endonuclease